MSKVPEPGKNPVPPATTGTVAATQPVPAKITSPQMKLVELGREWKRLCDEGASLGDLAEKFACSKSKVRDLLTLAGLPEDLKQEYLQGKLGRKKVLAMVRARVKAAQKTEVIIATKEVQTNTQPNTTEKPQPSAPVNPQPSPPPVMTPEQRQKKVEAYKKLVIDWLHSLDLGYSFWDALFMQVNLALYGGFPWLFSAEAPRAGENWTGRDPQEVIALFKPVKEGDTAAEVVNNFVQWLARWIQRVIPDRKMMKDALSLAESALLREANEKGSYCNRALEQLYS